MFADVRGHTITTDNQSAAADCSDAIEKFVRRKIDVVPCLQSSLNADSGCGFAQAVFGLMLHGARNQSLGAQMEATLKLARAGSIGATAREKMYVSALEKAVAGDLFGMVSCFENILNDNPVDLLALVLAQGELFWLGEMPQSARISQNVSTSWNHEVPGYSDFLSVRAFDLEEAGEYEWAESAGREAVSLDSDNVWGAHAVAHVLLMQGRNKEGVDWLEGLQGNWQETNQMKFHIWWHQCLFHLERKDYEAVLNSYDRWVRNHEEVLVLALPDLYIDLQNGASMLWRLEHAGVDVGKRWQEMAELVVPRLADMSSPFTSAHFAMILAAVGQFDDCDTLLAHMREFEAGEHTLASRYTEAALPAAQGAILHRCSDYSGALDIMLPARHKFWQMGGSHAQQDVFFQILVDSAFRLGQADLVNKLLTEIELIGFTEPSRRVAYESAARINS